jgi:outer membrane biosynthesis protein TonB
MTSVNTEKVIRLDSRRSGFFGERAPPIPPSRDAAEPKNRAIARGVAFLLHFLVLLLLLLGATWHEPAPAPPPIPIEVVMTPPPTPKALPIQAPKSPPKAALAQPLTQLESGGSPDLTSGRPAAKAPAKEGAEVAKPVPPTKAPRADQVQGKAEPALTKELPAPKPPREAAQPQRANPFLVPQAKEKMPQQEASVPQKNAVPILTYPPGAPASSVASAPEFNQSDRVGEGGGNRYLNAMRDQILSNLIYPPSAQGATGVAHYRMVVARNGLMLALRLIETSGSTALDRAGADAIQNSIPFQPLPQNVPGDAVAINVTLYIGPK